MNYPLIPKSTSRLTPGQFWAVPMATGSFACGRVLQIGTEHIPTKTRAFFGGLHDWVGDHEPTSDAISNSGFIAYGVMHIKAVTTTGGAILGERDLTLDGIRMPRMMCAQGGIGTMILDGSKNLRMATRDEWGAFPVLGYWGYDFITKLAKQKLGAAGGGV